MPGGRHLSVLPQNKKNTNQTSCGGSLVWWVTEKAPSDTCFPCASSTWCWRMNRRTSPVFSDTKSFPLPSAEESARKLLTWKPCTLKRCYSIHLTCSTLCSPLWSLAHQANDKKRSFPSNTERAPWTINNLEYCLKIESTYPQRHDIITNPFPLLSFRLYDTLPEQWLYLI